MRILVTGGGGFLGSRIVELLLDAGHEVAMVARSEYPHIKELGVETFQGDLSDNGVARQSVRGCDAVVHAAAQAGVWGPFDDFFRSNVETTRQVIAACKDEGVTKLVFTSSPSVTFDGTDQRNLGRDAEYPDRFLAHYPETKAQAEKLVLQANGDELRTTALRPHLIYGPGDPHLVPRLVEAARQGRLRIVGNGQNRVDLTYVDNAAIAHLQALEELGAQEPACAGRAYFIADGEPVLLWEWINRLLEELEIEPVQKKISPGAAYFAGTLLEGVHRLLRPRTEPRMTRFVARQLATDHYYDMEPARKDFGYEPMVTPDEAFQRLVRHLRSGPDSARN